MVKKRKITVVLPKKALEDAMEYTGKNITDTLDEALVAVIRGRRIEKIKSGNNIQLPSTEG